MTGENEFVRYWSGSERKQKPMVCGTSGALQLGVAL